ncbi:hypothetical protein E2C01_056918 [Portunus trituberculatus]|uniref:Uncharacterized protein n=1 Tax=Portunus trituberculatus TaxID=210409 RepID=A0A5B7H0W6_PORTR|nr:hypothetical protein [Portunus trituberculatus]
MVLGETRLQHQLLNERRQQQEQLVWGGREGEKEGRREAGSNGRGEEGSGGRFERVRCEVREKD